MFRAFSGMVFYLLTIFRSKFFSMGTAVFGLAVALAFFLACMQIIDTLRSGHPSGTDFDGTPVSFFAYISSMEMNFFLDPRQISALQDEFGDTADLIAASGGRIVDVVVTETESSDSLVVDVVSDNLFDALGVAAASGSLELFKGTEPVVVVSEKYIEQRGKFTAPDHIQLAGRSYRVIAVAETFSGLFNARTDVWVPWQHGHNILYPDIEDRGLFNQPGLYWAVAIPKEGKSAEFQQRLAAAKKRTDLLYPPWDSFRSVEGITYSEPKRRAADQAINLYFFMSLMMLAVAALNLACWVGLLRASTATNDATFIQLGIPLFAYAGIEAFYTITPVLLAFLIGIPGSAVLIDLLSSTPPVADFFAVASNIESNGLVSQQVMIFLLVCLFGFVFGKLISHSAGVSYRRGTGRPSRFRMQSTFRAILLFSACVCAMGFFLTVSASKSGLGLLKHLDIEGTETTWFLPLKHQQQDISEIGIESLQVVETAVRQNLRDLEGVGFVASPPFVATYQPLGLSLEEFGDPVASAFIQTVTPGTLEALRLKPVQGRLLDAKDGYGIVVEQRLADMLSRQLPNNSVIGTKLYDAAGRLYRTVGVVDHFPYTADPESDPLVAYALPRSGQKNPTVMVITGPESDQELSVMLRLLQRDHQMGVSGPYRLSESIQSARTPLLIRVVLLLAACSFTALIAMLSLYAVSSVEFKYRQKTYAVFSALGATPFKILWMALNGLLLTMIGGILIAIVLVWLFSSLLQTIGLFSPGESIVLTLLTAIALLIGVSVVSLSASFLNTFHRTSPGELLSYDQA